MIGLCVDSNSQISSELVERFGIEVVPLRVTIDGHEYRERVDLTVDEFYSFWDDGGSPEVSTSQPPPTDFVDSYQRLVERGATEILSVHVSDSMSGTLNAARLASDLVDVPVRMIDTGTVSFGIACCAWSAAEAIGAGADLHEAGDQAVRTATDLGTAFIVGVPQLADRSGRSSIDVESACSDGIPVLAMSGGDLEVLDTVTNVEDAVAVIAGYGAGWPAGDRRGSGERRRIAIGTSDRGTEKLGDLLVEQLTAPEVDLVRYRIGPSVGAHMGPGTAGLFVC
jgi:DegV family protein with EDD domain